MAHELHSFFNGTTVAHAESKKKTTKTLLITQRALQSV